MPTSCKEPSSLSPLRLFALAVAICIGLYAIGLLLKGCVNVGIPALAVHNPASSTVMMRGQAMLSSNAVVDAYFPVRPAVQETRASSAVPNGGNECRMCSS